MTEQYDSAHPVTDDGLTNEELEAMGIGVLPKTWVIPEQTRLKHTLLEKYLLPYMRVVGGRRGWDVINYIDGFAGPGSYDDPEAETGKCDGSPVIAAKAAAEIRADLSKIGRSVRFNCINIEQDPGHFASLQAATANLEQPGAIKIINVNEDLKEAIDFLVGLDLMKTYPSFWFVDPFGIVELDFSHLKTILDLPRNEVLVYFSYSGVIRCGGFAIKHEQSQDPALRARAISLGKRVDSFMGTTAWRDVIPHSADPIEKEQLVLAVFQERIEKLGYMTQAFRITAPGTKRILYHLVHCTRNITGFKIMRDLMTGLREKHDRISYNQPSLFDLLKEPPLEQVRQRITKFAGQTNVSSDAILTATLPMTELASKQVNQALRELLKEGILERSHPAHDSKGWVYDFRKWPK